MKTCTMCHTPKPLSEFSPSKAGKNGRRSWCRECVRIHMRDVYAKSEAGRATLSRKRKNRYKTHRADELIKAAKSRSKRRGWAFDLDLHVEDVQARIDLGLCELSGIPFDLNAIRGFTSPSIDRISPDLGYIYTNIRIICTAMNMALGNWGEEILHAVLTSWNDKREREGKGFSGINAEIFTGNNRQTSIDLI